MLPGFRALGGVYALTRGVRLRCSSASIQGGLLNRDALDLVERDLIAGAVVKLRGARAFVRGHGLSVFERAAGLEIGGDAGRAEHVAAELDLEAGFGRPPADH